ncbi:hypothetical protein MXB_2060 [Myxobolus squamalis]|nr:hypothetical protein MXB_2060 [Myxobolus squamalis]
MSEYEKIFHHTDNLAQNDLRHVLQRRRIIRTAKLDDPVLRQNPIKQHLIFNVDANSGQTVLTAHAHTHTRLLHASIDTHFPGCTQGRNCLYAHPLCRYNQQLFLTKYSLVA